MLLLAWASLASSAPVLAQAYQCTLPKRIERPPPETPKGPVRRGPVAAYTLAASWSPEYCRLAHNKGSMQCSGANGRFGFVLHGLWPEARFGPSPQWCSTTPRPSPELIRRNLCMTPVPWLLEHEWAKHGSCITGKPETYFKVSAILWRSLRWPDADRLSRQKDLTAGDLRRAFVRANPAWQAQQVGILASRTGWLREVHLCYGRDFMPRNCPARIFGPADVAPLKIWRGL
ncbi:MAG: ribonuclease T [Novosphingobium sp.]|nr:ribonuclease T [Novosphingobium sp.]